MTAPRLLLALHLAAGVAVGAGLGGLPRIVVVGLWVSIVPGWWPLASVRLDPATRLAMTVSTSLAIVLLLSTLLVLVDRFRGPTPFWLVFAVATPGVLLVQLPMPWAPTPVPED